MSASNQSPHGETAFAIAQEARLVPRWSIALSVLAFVTMQYLYWVVLPAHRHHPSTIPDSIRIYLSLSWSVLAALYVLMIGYVSNDSPRRNMNTGFWMFVSLMPGGIGLVLYFLLRQPTLSVCPSCSARIQNEFHFCPQCSFQVSAACGNCYRSVRASYLYCAHCGHDLSVDKMPARLRSFPS